MFQADGKSCVKIWENKNAVFVELKTIQYGQNQDYYKRCLLNSCMMLAACQGEVSTFEKPS